jgi:hypothetical protein
VIHIIYLNISFLHAVLELRYANPGGRQNLTINISISIINEYFWGMGCSAAKNLTVEPIDGNKVTDLSNGHPESRKVSIPRSVSDVPPLEGEDPQTEVLEAATVNNLQKGGEPMI